MGRFRLNGTASALAFIGGTSTYYAPDRLTAAAVVLFFVAVGWAAGRSNVPSWPAAIRREARSAGGGAAVLAGLVAAAFFGLGLAVAALEEEKAAGSVRLPEDGRPFSGVGTLASPAIVDGDRVIVRLKLRAIRWDGADSEGGTGLQHEAPGAPAAFRPALAWASLRLERPEERLGAGRWAEGATVYVTGVLRPLPAPKNPGAFDFGRFLWQEGIAYTVTGAFRETRVLADAPPPARFRQSALRAAREAFRTAPPEAEALALAVVFGDKSGLGAETLSAFQAAGVYHLLVVSGVHVGILAGTVAAALRAAGIGRRTRETAVLAFVWLYAYLAGGGIPVLRGAAMVTAYGLARRVGRVADKEAVLAWTAVLFLLVAPRQVTALGFQLSFALTAALVRYAPPLGKGAAAWLRRRGVPEGHAHRIGRGLAALGLTEGLSALFLLGHLGAWPAISPFANAALLPLYALGLPAAAASTVLAAILQAVDSRAAPLLAWPAAAFFSALHRGVEGLAAVTGTARSFGGALQTVGLFVSALGILGVLEGVRRRLAWAGLRPLYPPVFRRRPNRDARRGHREAVEGVRPESAARRRRRAAAALLIAGGVGTAFGLFGASFGGPRFPEEEVRLTFFALRDARVFLVDFPGKYSVLVAEAALEPPDVLSWRRRRRPVDDWRDGVVPALRAGAVRRLEGIVVGPAAVGAGGLAEVCRAVQVRRIWIVASEDGVAGERRIPSAGPASRDPGMPKGEGAAGEEGGGRGFPAGASPAMLPTLRARCPGAAASIGPGWTLGAGEAWLDAAAFAGAGRGGPAFELGYRLRLGDRLVAFGGGRMDVPELGIRIDYRAAREVEPPGGDAVEEDRCAVGGSTGEGAATETQAAGPVALTQARAAERAPATHGRKAASLTDARTPAAGSESAAAGARAPAASGFGNAASGAKEPAAKAPAERPGEGSCVYRVGREGAVRVVVGRDGPPTIRPAVGSER
ncbi:MAG: Late competence protein ComEC, DNA transport [Hydrogenibacillus schlegelii]|uniref:Late competence protein ComEC, DNA transport n=1 Tax=Hydrogenibacillus schlegelii TaxID=1484 RepID=A0A2T5G6N3_HYDSH|nr:ComEC/Rec2 family competence protein [Hydrogenibacillus schlegelii]PTQ51856.1 MAG: Late competence protein ComEC, DNA transport [Hydrogenibacillus schlegelii]